MPNNLSHEEITSTSDVGEHEKGPKKGKMPQSNRVKKRGRTESGRG